MDRNEQELFGLFDVLTDGVAVLKNGRVVYANPRAVSLLGEGLVGSIAEQRFDGLLAEPALGSLSGCVRCGERLLGATAVNMGAFRVITIPLTSSGEGLLLTGSLGALMRGDLNTVSSGLGLLAEDLRRARDLKSLQILARMERAIRHMTRTVGHCEALLGGSLPRDDRGFDLVTLMRDTVDSVEQMTRDRGVTMTFASSLEEYPYYGDQELLQLLILNLLSNSLRATPSGGRIAVTMRDLDRKAFIEVRDNGRGIPREEQVGIFSKYLTPRTLDDPGGAGMGLALVQTIAGLYDGSAVLWSEPGEGTAVSVLLPPRPIPDRELREPSFVLRPPERIFLTELSDVLDYTAYMNKE